MAEEDRHRILAKLAIVWAYFPDRSFAQLLYMLTPAGLRDPFDIPDVAWESSLDRCISGFVFSQKT